MKKARILLASIAVVGILGGAFAFKAAKFGTKNYYVAASTSIRATQTVPLGYITAVGNGTYWTTVYNSYPTNFATVASGL